MALDRTKLSKEQKYALERGWITPSEVEYKQKVIALYEEVSKAYSKSLQERDKLVRKLTVERMRATKFHRKLSPIEKIMRDCSEVLNGIERKRDLYDDEFKEILSNWNKNTGVDGVTEVLLSVRRSRGG